MSDNKETPALPPLALAAPPAPAEPPRAPRTMQGLLRFATEVTAAEDPTRPTELSPMDEERKKWLEDAMNSMSVNVGRILVKNVEILRAGADTEDLAERQERALEELLEWVDNVDFANDFLKIGGFTTVPDLLQSPFIPVRFLTAELVGELVQNNPVCQNAATEAEILPLLLNALDQDEEKVKEKAMFAVSSLVRDNPVGQESLLLNDGLSVILRAMEGKAQKLKVKASFMITALCAQNAILKDTLCKMGYVEQLVSLLQREHDPSHEHVASALRSLTEGHSEAIKECQRPELNLKDTLNDRIAFLAGKDEFLEELDHCQQILKLAFPKEKRTQQEEDLVR